MTTAYTSLLGLALPVTGELSGTWGDTVNDSITSLLDTAVAGTTNVSADSNVTLTTTTGASNQARQAILLFSGARTAIRTVTAPAQSKVYTVINATTGGYAVKLVGSGPTTGINIANGSTTQVTWNGSDFVEVSRFSALVVLSSYSGYTGGEVLLGQTTADIQSGIATQATGSPILYFDHRATSNTGVFAWRNGSSGANELMRLTSTGLGIGTNSPASRLDVTGADNTGATLASRVYSANRSAFLGFGFNTISANSNASGLFLEALGANVMTFSTNGSERARIDSSGNLGIGTTSISSKLYVAGGTNDQLLRVGNTNAVGTQYISIWANGAEAVYNSVNTQNAVYGSHVWNAQNNGGTVERARIDSSGNLLVGTTSQFASSKLCVTGSGAFNTGGVDGTYTSFINAVYSGNTAQFSSIQHSMSSAAGAAGFRFLGGGAGGGGTTQQKMYDMTRGAHIFYITDTEVARIDGSGNFMVGTTINYYGEKIGAYNSSSYNFTSTRTGTGSEGHFVFQNGNGVAGTIFTSGSSTSYNTTSDQRLKENIEDAESASSLIDGLQVRKFDWKVDGLHQRYGFIAQELLTVAPEAVSQPETPEQMMSVDYSKLVPMLVKEIQSLRKRLADAGI